MDALERFCRNNLAKQYTKVDETKRNDLILKAQGGDTTARDIVLDSSYPYILSSVKKYKDNYIPMCDLITVGSIGVNKAIKSYDPTKKSCFLAWAEYHIRREVQQEIGNNSRTIRIPMPTRAMAKRYHVAMRRIGEHADSFPKEIEKLAGITEAQRKNIEAIPQTSSANLPFYKDGARTEIIEMLRGEEENTLENIANKNLVKKLFECLTDIEKDIIRRRFLVVGKSPIRTGGECLNDIAKELNVTRERIRQIERIAIDKMKRRAKTLEFMGI